MDKYDVRTYLFIVLFGLAVFIVLFSCFGMLFKWMRNRCCTVLYGTCLLPLWVATVAIGGGAVFISYTAADEFEGECENVTSVLNSIDTLPLFTSISPASITGAEDNAAGGVDAAAEVADDGTTEVSFGAEEGTFIDNVRINLNLFKDIQTDKHMCSRDCPCSTEGVTTSDWLDIDAETLLEKYDRKLEFQFGPLEGDDYTVTSYQECIETIGSNYYATQEFRDFATGWSRSDGYNEEVEYMKFFEDEYECSGICKDALFAFTRPISAGKPESCF